MVVVAYFYGLCLLFPHHTSVIFQDSRRDVNPSINEEGREGNPGLPAKTHRWDENYFSDRFK